jgi:hypothetical protein
LLLSLAVLTAAAACDDNTLVSTTPTPIVTTSETFTGTLTKNGAVTHQFSVSSRGNVTATLTKIDPDSGMTIGVSLGTWNGTSCYILSPQRRGRRRLDHRWNGLWGREFVPAGLRRREAHQLRGLLDRCRSSVGIRDLGLGIRD